jgi:transaldolase
MSDNPSATANPLVALSRLGQSPWYDFITRDLVRSGELARLIHEDGLKGMTSNPTIFEKAVATSTLYDSDIQQLADRGRSPAEIFEALAVADVQAACDVFRTVFEQDPNGDGTVSLEVSPTLAHDTDGTVREAERLWAAVDRPNVMIKIPGTREGLPAISRCLGAGINVNVTLLFSVSRYREVIDAFMTGMEAFFQTPRAGTQRAPCSVASFFVSRLDGRVDPLLERAANRGHVFAGQLRGTIAIANAATAYEQFGQSLHQPRWHQLAARGAYPQRPLWASTSSKNPRLADVYYVEALIGPRTVNTLPPETFAAFREHGQICFHLEEHVAQAPGQLEALATYGIDLGAVTRDLEADGVAKFAASYRSLLAGIEAKAGALVAH